MRNIDDKTFSAIIERIETLKNELSLLEEQVKALTVDAGQPLEAGQVHPRSAAAEYGLASTAAPAVEAPAEADVILSESVILSEAKDLPETEDLPADETAEEEPIDIAPVDDTPIDISISDIEDLPDDAGQPLESGRVHPRSAAAEYGLDSTAAPADAFEPGKAILDTAKADTAVMDVMAEKQAWRTDRPGMPVKNIISAISLNDRVFLINTLFGEDPVLFQETISKFNTMGSLSETLDYISKNHPDWDMSSDPVYRLMMAVRRKLR